MEQKKHAQYIFFILFPEAFFKFCILKFFLKSEIFINYF